MNGGSSPVFPVEAAQGSGVSAPCVVCSDAVGKGRKGEGRRPDLGLACSQSSQEDCLHLDVWLPKGTAERSGKPLLPVLVWTRGCRSDPNFGG